MAWIWSDELAQAAEAAGLEHRDLTAWKRRPVAYPYGESDSPVAVARELLGLPDRESEPDAPPAMRVAVGLDCTCAAVEVLADTGTER